MTSGLDFVQITGLIAALFHHGETQIARTMQVLSPAVCVSQLRAMSDRWASVHKSRILFQAGSIVNLAVADL
jgi:hypothetical protein